METTAVKLKTKLVLKKTKEGKLKIIPLGGLEEIGRNLIILELEQKNKRKEMIIVDIGLGYPEETMLGIDYTIPNFEYLEKNKEYINAILITHGHYDHIGAIPYILEKIGNPPIYATPLTKGLIIKRQQDYPNAIKPTIIEIKKEEPKILKIGSFIIEYFHVNHNIPDSIGFFIQTPVCNVMHTGDFKLDFNPIFDKPADLSRIVKLAQKGTDILLLDSTNAPEQGHVISERKIMENLEEIFKRAKGRIIASTFASLLERIQQLIYLAEQYGRKVVVDGHTMKINVEVAKRLGYLKYEKGTFIKPDEALRLPPNKVLIICTGSQAEEGSALMRIANQEHKYFKIIKGDTLIFSSSIVPGNERIVQNLKDTLTKQGAKIFHYQMMDIHASGHAFADDIRLFINLVKPKYIIPIHGYYYMLKAVQEICNDLNMPAGSVIILSNGDILEVQDGIPKITNEKVPSNLIYVDGLGLGNVGDVVLRDRKVLAEEGMFVIIVIIDSQTGKLKKSPDIISRGFVYLRESQALLKGVRNLIAQIVKKNVVFLGDEAPIIQEDQIKYRIKEDVAEYLFKKTYRRPVILPVVLKV